MLDLSRLPGLPPPTAQVQDECDGAVDGGALALGHPFGASGAVLVTRPFSQLVRSPVTAPPVEPAPWP